MARQAVRKVSPPPRSLPQFILICIPALLKELAVTSKGVQCVNLNGRHVATSKCAFGRLWSGNFEEGKVRGENFNISYGDGEFLTGTLGYEDVLVAGITVKHQEIASVTEGYWNGDGVTSGIIGFAYSALTAAYSGTDPSQDNPKTNNVHYENWIDNAIDEGKIDSLFSVAIERGANGGGGQIALGGLPTIDFNHSFASTPLEIHSFTPRHPLEKTNFTYYTIQPDGWVVDGESVSTNFRTIVARYATAINYTFDPPAECVPSSGVFETACNAKLPDLAVTIGGKNFKISAAELLLKGEQGRDPSTGLCVTGIQAAPGPPAILGDTFPKNVVAVFDVGKSEMRFAPHVNY
ncbi:uncharacterized protein LTR77_008976 [Saxophila tyrrhenica]|uniref:Peptidase A1 domain-containing protein n=1 Tax=Saxophila tyrrhenica TaxID=1690608 RepID=A0AAV9P025_9PEZI|nr:hypothetical protein LTR77_008976 [Saxophila tyrrhenica]